MIKKIRIKIAAIMMICICTTVIFQDKVYSTASSSSINDRQKTIILVDPGHGGIDGGAEAKDGTMEKNINLKISSKLKNNLKKQGYTVLMTRESDKGLYTQGGKIRKKKVEDLGNRARMKNDTNCNMFISIHLNKFPQSKYYGAQVWYSKNQDSKQLAKIIQDNLIRDLDSSNNRHEKAALDLYKILRENDDMPSVIVECGFLSNDQEREKLKSDDYQNKIADSIAKSVNEYYKCFDK
ncbi:MAG: N-acetylmuramoyl-L-alanine amidase CwlD [Clostridium sp.]|jgi:N-acetylmuramoyl-L-alanine amidase|uniref:N-acetylmuramoyl-L-alanine amidase CwlD n=1 Tax=Clostridium sp. TaxID=1506 RepID=UPI0025C465ED|nr:N-acetylmuramoyl-L-alanine amidase CwlD [Clostridium sp.]MCH3965709.1 N-acetylmuramoyl-L-alanine amidase CwlD [Clostridium sp.]MCI1717085.1 N-acetylmuramoyl-L-alanine amidase CwlD [Clostridium sp.]MCI1801378.1 N-acetylmuramoyl-L-alanine amidase CwlD [Clostridium sp.]MCI1815224.1 N-acetylmuramoyl-L-alanine amidase CwlD [Clostridium sp.]MCI1872127.1 N-acetylmuramoyl-L-alanine amidase CwlD [Clostridium sp.]